MKIWPFQRKALSINQVMDRIEAVMASKSGVSVTPETCERAPTVKAIVTAISRRVAVSPVMVLQKTHRNGRDYKKQLPDHPISKTLKAPNEYQDRVTFWLDMASQLVRYNNCFAWKGTDATGQTRRLVPLHSGDSTAKLKGNNFALVYETRMGDEAAREYPADRIWHTRGAARDFLNGDSPVTDVSEAIALEIAAEEYGATFFGNGAVPMLVFKLMDGFKEWKTQEEKDKFIRAIKEKLGGGQRHTAFMLPKGIELDNKDNYTFGLDKVQFVDARKYQRTVIAGAFGVPPHLVGDLERATFNNVEQQDSDFTINVVLPYVRMLESSMERDLLTDEDRAENRVIRFNLDAIQRADFKSRQEGLQIQRLNGVISANDWRERENLNPLDEEEGGEAYWMPSNYQLPGEQDDETDQNDEVDDNADSDNSTP